MKLFWILKRVHSIAHEKILQFNELQDFSLSFIRLGVELEGFVPYAPNAVISMH